MEKRDYERNVSPPSVFDEEETSPPLWCDVTEADDQIGSD